MACHWKSSISYFPSSPTLSALIILTSPLPPTDFTSLWSVLFQSHKTLHEVWLELKRIFHICIQIDRAIVCSRPEIQRLFLLPRTYMFWHDVLCCFDFCAFKLSHPSVALQLLLSVASPFPSFPSRWQSVTQRVLTTSQRAERVVSPPGESIIPAWIDILTGYRLCWQSLNNEQTHCYTGQKQHWRQCTPVGACTRYTNRDQQIASHFDMVLSSFPETKQTLAGSGWKFTRADTKQCACCRWTPNTAEHVPRLTSTQGNFCPQPHLALHKTLHFFFVQRKGPIMGPVIESIIQQHNICPLHPSLLFPYTGNYHFSVH